MATPSADPGGLEPCRTGTDHHHAPVRPTAWGNDLRHSALTAGGGVVQAQCLALPVDAIDAVTGTDARADLVFLTADDLGHDVRVGKVCTGHAHQIQQSFLDGIAGGRHIVDAGGVHHRQVEMALDRTGKLQIRGLRCAHVGDDIGHPLVAVHVTSDHANKIDHAGVHQDLPDSQTLVELDAALYILVERHAHAHDVVTPHLPPNFLQHLQREAHAVFQRAAVFIGTAVDGGRPEAVQQVAVGFYLDAVQIPLATARRRRPVGFDYALDVPVLHHLGKRPVSGFAYGRGRDDRQPVALVVGGTPAEVRNLAHRGRTVSVHTSGKLPKVRHDAIITGVEVAIGGRGVRCHQRAAAEHGQRNTAPGFFLMVQLVAQRR